MNYVMTENEKRLYKGFIPLNEKNRIVKKSVLFETLDEAMKHSPNRSVGGVINDDVIYLDFDSHKEESKEADSKNMNLFLQIINGEGLCCFIRKTTTGFHAFFLDSHHRVRKNYVDAMLSCGLHSDVKIGDGASYEPIIVNGKVRGIEKDSSIIEIPSFFLPMSKKTNLVGLREGDGRNTVLFSYLCSLMCNGLSKEEAKETVTIINGYIFDEKLSNREIETITRDNAFPKEIFIEEKRLRHDKLAEFLINSLNIKKINGVLYVFKGKCYEDNLADGNYINGEIIRRVPFLTKNQRSEVYSYIKENNSIISHERVNPDYICFENGLLNIRTWKLEPHTPEVFVTNLIPHNYSPSSFSRKMDKALNDWCNGSNEERSRLEEAVGICLSSSIEFQKMFILFGEKNNGKSTFFKALMETLGFRNVSNLDMGTFGERFAISSIANKLANIGDDISEKPIDADTISRLKKVVTGDTVKGEYKGENVFFFNPYATLFFSANVIPYFKDSTGAMLRRIELIPFEHKFLGDRQLNISFDEEAYEFLIAQGIKGLYRVLSNNGRITESRKAKVLTDKLITHVDTIRAFVDSLEDGIKGLEGRYTKDVHKEYVRFCLDSDSNYLEYSSFSKNLMSSYSLEIKHKRIDGRTYRVFSMA